MRALRVVWDPRPIASFPSGFTSALGTGTESPREGSRVQRMIRYQLHALLSSIPGLRLSGAIAPKSRLFNPCADHVGVTQARRVVRPARALIRICFDHRANRRPMRVRDPVGLRARTARVPSGNDAVPTS
jgi:hypothetical protein